MLQQWPQLRTVHKFVFMCLNIILTHVEIYTVVCHALKSQQGRCLNYNTWVQRAVQAVEHKYVVTAVTQYVGYTNPVI
jgi:hypothetical protein